MSKEQINYLLVLATLFIVWLYFNTFYVNTKKTYPGIPSGGVRSASAMKLPNLPEKTKVADLQNLLAGIPQGSRRAAGSRTMASKPAEASSIPLPPVPASEEKK